MITVTNGKENFEVANNTLWKRETPVSGLATKIYFEYWGVELVFISSKHKRIDKILKCLIDGDILEEYQNLDKRKKDYVLLNDNDYIKVKKLYFAIQEKENQEKEALIEGLAHILSFDFFQTCYVEDE